eukprot:276192-Pleurochrysis_carterae.AAC.1
MLHSLCGSCLVGTFAALGQEWLVGLLSVGTKLVSYVLRHGADELVWGCIREEHLGRGCIREEHLGRGCIREEHLGRGCISWGEDLSPRGRRARQRLHSR